MFKTVDSMLTEVKKNLSKYESLIKECIDNIEVIDNLNKKEYEELL